jgi:required for meiotic nuclear division protein 1
MPLLSALAYGFATTFKMRDLAPCFAGAKIRQAKTQIVAEYGPDRLAIGFDFGAIIFINVPGEERTRAIGTILQRVATDEPHPPLEEDFLIDVRDNAPPQGEVRFDRVAVPALDPPTVDVIAILLAQSVAIDYYEEDLQEILAGLARRTDHMARTGRILGSTREITRFVGSSISTKNQIIAALSLLDKPIVTWESESLDRLYRDLRTMLEIEDRYESLADKLRTIQETFELFLDLIATRRAQIMEMTIILLIALEIVMALAQKL